MENNCHQTLTIKGKQDMVKEIIEQLNESNEFISFSNLFPIPSEKELEELQLSKSEWCEEWYEVGTDFGILHDIEITEDKAIIEFHTRNVPCRKFIHQLCQIYEDVNFYLSFAEPYGCFSGYIECENGEVLQNEIGETQRIYIDPKTGKEINEYNDYEHGTINHEATTDKDEIEVALEEFFLSVAQDRPTSVNIDETILRELNDNNQTDDL